MSLSDCRITAVAAVSDLDQARSFYEGPLGLSLIDSGDGRDDVIFGCGEGTGLMVYASPEHAGKATATLACWDVKDLDAEMSSLREKGVEFEKYEGFDQDENGVLEMDGARVAWFTDPDGNTFAMAQV